MPGYSLEQKQAVKEKVRRQMNVSTHTLKHSSSDAEHANVCFSHRGMIVLITNNNMKVQTLENKSKLKNIFRKSKMKIAVS